MRLRCGSNAVFGTPRENAVFQNESVSGRSNFKMRNSDRYISMGYRAICADDCGDAQFAANNINDLHAKLRSPFI
jgi:hypothetical protein